MSNLSLVERSSEILTKYYENDIQPFLDAMHPEILWIGPAENQIFRGKARLEAAFRAEQNTLHFELHDLVILPVETGSPRTVEVILLFRVDTFWPDGTTNQVKQRIQLTWVQAGGQMYIRVCHISNAIIYDMRDGIYPLNYSDRYQTQILAGQQRAPRLVIKGAHKSTLCLSWEEILYIETFETHSLIHTMDDTYEALPSLRQIEQMSNGFLMRCHKSFLFNPHHVQEIARFYLRMPDGSRLPIPEKKYTALKAAIIQFHSQ